MLRNGLEPWHLLIVAIVVIVLFGSKKLPDTARALGKSMRILKSEAKAMKEENPANPATPESPAEPSGSVAASAVTPAPPVQPTTVTTASEAARTQAPAA
ncbi:Sec-independent protein translocase subunit TatA [Streptomyces acidiscabies]|uniref:Sec-independent protein translocase protein TatA n=1 Tax=Streptomyces acidiscabies TaxID=42234 RepID=A0AAP6ELE9_9ACTN|nr:Sec-independent protein translocase subunit TatA [Streptomyces acidiscabies]MBP5936185.1 Sec-independent protein translocase subunit TatA [Streptomyces sp. LBUM 1476]MBZ3915876.1 Sec-independent protein translocase subunit TatA [Streptomyces acidiscabies]MDX2967232.1 Sec-independent protein translocase subunit TatA [Streptomyces acidiscabies]MDX3026127.1 Sec-independent protein translocase subunit TatA [Streptomyces acidiscabies]MDX3793260.1 Sec-independent protein translocase subunit TatA 